MKDTSTTVPSRIKLILTRATRIERISADEFKAVCKEGSFVVSRTLNGFVAKVSIKFTETTGTSVWWDTANVPRDDIKDYEVAWRDMADAAFNTIEADRSKAYEVASEFFG